jgi:hypothetical protein
MHIPEKVSHLYQRITQVNTFIYNRSPVKLLHIHLAQPLRITRYLFFRLMLFMTKYS